MAKTVYKIPTTLGRSFLDHEIVLSGGGFQMKPVPVKVIAFWAGSILTLFWVLSHTYLRHASLWLLVLLVVWWIIATAFFGRYSSTKELNFKSVPPLLDYVTPGARKVVTRRGSNPTPFYSIAGIDDVDEDGNIRWGDGSVGLAFLVVGSASVLVFAADRIAILDRVDAFYRKLDTTAELIWLTGKEPQRVWRQLANLEMRNRKMIVRDPELVELLQEQHAILTQYVGGSFTSIHQYLVIKADNAEALRRAHVIVRAEAEESSLMIKQLTQLDGADTEAMFQAVYGSAH